MLLALLHEHACLKKRLHPTVLVHSRIVMVLICHRHVALVHVMMKNQTAISIWMLLPEYLLLIPSVISQHDLRSATVLHRSACVNTALVVVFVLTCRFVCVYH